MNEQVMKQQVSPFLLVAIGALVLAGLALGIWKIMSSSPGDAAPTIVRPANPNDPKYRPDPRLGLGGGGA